MYCFENFGGKIAPKENFGGKIAPWLRVFCVLTITIGQLAKVGTARRLYEIADEL